VSGDAARLARIYESSSEQIRHGISTPSRFFPAHQAKNRAAERHAAEIRVRAERRCGQLLKEMPKAKGAANGAPGPGRGNKTVSDEATAFSSPTLSQLGVTRDQSSEWQKLAEVFSS